MSKVFSNKKEVIVWWLSEGLSFRIIKQGHLAFLSIDNKQYIGVEKD